MSISPLGKIVRYALSGDWLPTAIRGGTNPNDVYRKVIKIERVEVEPLADRAQTPSKDSYSLFGLIRYALTGQSTRTLTEGDVTYRETTVQMTKNQRLIADRFNQRVTQIELTRNQKHNSKE
jgi:hypothetical protein